MQTDAMGEPELIVELAKRFMAAVRAIEPGWKRAFFRYCQTLGSAGSNASYSSDGDTVLFDPFRFSALFDDMNSMSETLLRGMGRDQGLLLLIVDDEFNFEIKFEWTDLERWKISKLEGASGIPRGL